MAHSYNNLQRYEIVVVGDVGAGKSALKMQMLVENSHTEIDGEECILNVLDTVSQEEFSATREQYTRKGDAFLLVYSVTDKASFMNIMHFYTLILRIKDKDAYPMVLVANKVDLVYLRQVSEEQGQEMANMLKIPYIETSAINPPVNVVKSFHEAVRIIRASIEATVSHKRDVNVSNVYDVIVIGGGAAGLSTCAQLVQSGFKNILLLEASNRLGGRVNTIKYENSLIELGAQWIHGNKGNPVYTLLNSLNEVDSNTQFYTDETIYSSFENGVSQTESKVDYIDEQIQNIFDEFEESVPSGTSKNKNFGALLEKEWQNLLLTKLKSYDKKLANAVYKAKLDDMRSDYACDNFYELSAQGYADYDDFGGEEFNNLKNGYIKLIQYLNSNLPSLVVKLNEKVLNIDWSLAQTNANGLIKVKSSNLNGVTNYQAKYVVNTFSLGVLKSNHKAMFIPSLPSEKASAIDRLGFGIVNKIFYVFDGPVFSGRQAGLQFLWTNDTNFVLNADKKYNLNGNTFYKSFNTFTVPPKNRNILFAFLVGKDSAFSETLSDDCLIDVIYELFTKFFPKLKLPRPKAVIRSKWSTNPLVQGSYSFTKVGSSISDTKLLAKSVNNKLFFAGEATTSYIGTVHGAYMTGMSTANTLKTLIK